MKVPVSPFLQAPPDTISHGGWFVTTPDGDMPLPVEMGHWDYQTTLTLAAPVSVDRRALTAGCGLRLNSGLAVLVLARSTRTRTERVVTRLEVPHRDKFDLAVEFDLAGAELGGRLWLDTLVVATEPQPLNGLAPQHPGSILWRTSHHTELEGVGSQFPTDSADFALTNPRNKNAGWELRIDLSDPDALFMSVVRLTLNSGHPAIRRLLQGTPDERSDQLLRTLNWDVTRQLVHAALRSDEVAAAEVDSEALTVAAVLRNILASIFPGESVITLKNWLASDPSRIEVPLQHRAGLMP